MSDFCKQQADAHGDFRRAVRFRKEKLGNLDSAASIGIAGSEHHTGGRVMLIDPASKTEPIHSTGHVDVAEDDIDRHPSGEYCDSLRRISRFDNQVAGNPQILSDGAADENLILDN